MAELVLQLVLGSAVLAVATVVQVLFISIAVGLRPHLSRRVGTPRIWPMTILVTIAALWLLLGQTIGVWLWAGALIWVEAFNELEPSVYYALSVYTTVGIGDELPEEEWRVFGTMAGANGMIAFGLAAAALVNLVSGVRHDLEDEVLEEGRYRPGRTPPPPLPGPTRAKRRGPHGLG